MQEISHIQKIFVDSHSSHGEPGTRLRVREAHTALPGEGATPLRGQARAPLIVRIALKEGVGYSG
jgi:hypothetical protein